MENLFTKKVPLYFETEESQLILGEASVDVIFDGAFAFAEIGDLEKKGYIMKPLGKQSPVFISHSSKDKNEVEKLLPYLNGSGVTGMV